MELHELTDRLFRLHAMLIIACLLIGLAAGLALQLRQTPRYQANTQLVMGAADPESAQNAAVLADTAHGIATGTQLVDKAISAAGVNRDETAVANAVSVQTLGSSGVVMLSVTDSNPRVAVALANSLASGVVNTRATLARNGLASSVHGLNQQEASIAKQAGQVNRQIADLTAQLVNTPSFDQAPIVAQLTSLESRLTSLQDQATQIVVQRNQLAAQQGPVPAVLDRATSAASTGGRGAVVPVLGALLGLVVGIAAAAVREMARPRMVGAAAISRAIGTPLLGEMSTPPDSWTLAALPDAGRYIELAADSRQVQEVRFAVLDPNGRRRAGMRMLEGPLHRLRFNRSRTADQPAEVAPNGHYTLLNPVSVHESSPRTGLVVAIPRVLKVADIDAVTNFVRISGWTLLGVIVFPAKRKAAAVAGRGFRPANAPRDDAVSEDVEV
jgi:capsular polysaccharide biosynthesis protein